MFTSNPWVVYASVISPILAGYYILIGLKYYRRDLKARLSNWQNPAVKAAGFTGQKNQKSTVPIYAQQPQEDSPAEILTAQPQEGMEFLWENEPLMDQLENLSLQLKKDIEEAHEKQYSRDELVFLLQMTIHEYPNLYGTPFQLSVNSMIEAECAKYGAIHLRAQDREMIWNQVDQ